MPSIPNRPNIPGGGWRQQRAAQLRAEAEAEERIQRAPAEGQVGLGDDRMHCVQEGETIESIADLHDCSPESIWSHPSNAELSAQDDDACTLTPGDNVYIPADDEQPAQPVGQGEHAVREGECISSIAKDTGHFWQTIWNDPANAELKEVRGNPNILLPGDRVTIPEKRRKKEPRETEQRHRFVRRGDPAMLRVRVLKREQATVRWERIWGDEHDELDATALEDEVRRRSGRRDEGETPEPRSNEPYTLEIDGRKIEGITSPNGEFDVPIVGSNRRARLVVGEGQNTDEYLLRLGNLDPVETMRGIQQRLNNLGYDCGKADGIIGPKTRGALHRFQRDHKLTVTKRPDKGTRKKLIERHGC